MGAAGPLSYSSDAPAKGPPVLGHGLGPCLPGPTELPAGAMCVPPRSSPRHGPQTRRAKTGTQPSPFIPVSGVRHRKQTETHPKRNSWPSATLQLPSPGSAWHFSNVKAKGCRAARQPGLGGSLLGLGGGRGGGAGDKEGDGKGCRRGGRDTRNPCSCHCHRRGGGGRLGEAEGAHTG